MKDDPPVAVENVYKHALALMRQHPDLTSVAIGWRYDDDGDPIACATGCVVTLPGTEEPITAEMLAEHDDTGELAVLAGIRGVRCAHRAIDEFVLASDPPNS